jgi:osmotically-inducible protein OsmY
MKIRTTLTAAAIALTLVTVTGCAVTRGQQTAGAYVDDTAITASVKTRMLEDERVAGTSVTVETLNGTVMLSGFAKSQAERSAAESIARKVDGVRAVKNEITVRPAS